jgi:chemotaxis protein CheZ
MSAMKADNFVTRHRATLAGLNHAFASGDEGAFELAMDELFASRKSLMLHDVQRMSEQLLGALTRFRSGSRMAALAGSEIPDARLRLDHVLTMTEEAAHRTLDIIEQSVPLAAATARSAAALADTLDERSHREIRHFLTEVRSNAEQVRRNLTEVMVAQGFHDMTGQVLGSVRTLVGELESVLQELALISGVTLRMPVIPPPDVTAQADVDELIAGYGI